ncbi:YIP1 family protein [Pseudooceanicola onchidii]|uniref:YIP1 family protein n=1 Tax=Pseudooceanicola onchidii TaxID=2562279 RepID=UPI0010AB1C1A|nr:YIP1 family protein [Pseudooceanicola onchidii]
MSILRDIVATYRGPVPVLQRRIEGGAREDRALAVLMAGCGLLFVAQWPRLARQSFETGAELEMLMGGSLMALVFILPLILYGLGALSHAVARVVGGQGGFYSARMALFWALLATAPAFLLNGLTEGFLGAGPQTALTGLLALGVFLWFWVSGLWAVEKGRI